MKRYWRSLGPERPVPPGEFPEGASEAPDRISRRTMLKLAGATVSLAGATACRRPVEKIVPYVSGPEEILPGVPRHYATLFPGSRGAQGLLVETHEGRPTKIEGNPDHPSTEGASGTFHQASILDLYDPDRLAKIRNSEGDRGEEDLRSFIRERVDAHAGGRGLAVLLRPGTSPTLARLARRFRATFPQAQWVAWEPLSDENAVRGAALAGRPGHRAVPDLRGAQVVLTLDADLLGPDPESVRHGRALADGRRVEKTGNRMNRLWAVEPAMTVTGSAADHRARVRRSRIPALLAQLGRELRRAGVDVPLLRGLSGAEVAPAAFVSAVAQDLAAHRGTSVVVAGPAQPPAVHAAVAAINDALGNTGRTVRMQPVVPELASDEAALTTLAIAMGRGEVETLVVLGGNPVLDAPADLDFAAGLDKVAHAIHLTDRENETSKLCAWRAPRAHFLESWSDARDVDGRPGVVQPLVAPLFGGRTDAELVSVLLDAEPVSGHELVRATWREILGDTSFESAWQQTLFRGFHPQTEPMAAGGGEGRPDRAGTELRGLGNGGADGELEIVFLPSPQVLDGRYANNGWLQELPHPISKITWDNAAMIAPRTAARIGLTTGDRAVLRCGEREVTAPVWVTPGVAEDTVAVEVGFGRRASGRVGTGVGFDAYALRTTGASGFATVDVTPADGTHVFADTQHHGDLDPLGEGEIAKRVPRLVREATLARHTAKNDWVETYEVNHPALKSLWHEHEYDHGHQWGMVIDLNTCFGCNACVIACQSENNIPVVGKEQVRLGREMHWIRIDRYFAGSEEEPEAVFQPVPCMHCENAPCEQVCPVAATVHDGEGLNTMVYNRCIGTRYCANNCPYKVRRFNFYNFTKDTPEVQRMAANPDVTVRSRGVMEKCTYCVQRINQGKLAAKLAGRPLRDGDVTPACAQACPSRAISFGDLRDEESRVASAKSDPRNYQMLRELNNKPRTSYLGRLRNPHPSLAPLHEPDDPGHGDDHGTGHDEGHG